MRELLRRYIVWSVQHEVKALIIEALVIGAIIATTVTVLKGL